MHGRSAVWRLGAALVLLAPGFVPAPALAQADGLAISPVRVDLVPGRKSEVVTLSNAGSARKTVQAEVVAWRQQDGADVYEPTSELLVSPPLFFLEPGARQVVRIGRPTGAPPAVGAERSYRVFFQEIPDADGARPAIGLRFALRIGIPVFALPVGGAAERLEWTAHRQADGALRLVAANTGAAHAKISDLALSDPRGEALPAEGFRYVLPGSRQEWLFRPPQPLPATIRVSARTEAGATELELVPRVD